MGHENEPRQRVVSMDHDSSSDEIGSRYDWNISVDDDENGPPERLMSVDH